MIRLNFEKLETILCLGAHSDDLEIGCGGTLLTLLGEHPNLRVHWVVLSAAGERAAEATSSANELLSAVATKQITLHSFRDTCFPFVGQEIKEVFLKLAREVQPDLIFTHRREDQHQDHRLIAELTWNAFRNHLIWEYEIPKYEGDWARQTVSFRWPSKSCGKKSITCLSTFPRSTANLGTTQACSKRCCACAAWSAAAESKLAEAFYCRKCVVG